MLITTDVKHLHDVIAHAVKAIPARVVVPVLAGVRLDVADGLLAAAAFDYSSAATATLDVAEHQPGQALVPGRMLADMLNRLPAGPVTVAVDDRAPVLTVTAGRAKCVLPLLPVEDYPNLPALPEKLGEVDGATWADALKYVELAAYGDETLPQLCAVRLESDGRKLTLVATDRYRAHVVDLEFDGPQLEALLPAGAVKAVLGVDAETVALHADDRSIAVSGDGRTASTMQVGGQYIHWRQLWPVDPPHTLTLDAGALAEAMRRCSIVAGKRPAVLTIGGNTVEIEAGQDEKVSDELDCEYDGPSTQIGFNTGFLADLLSCTGGQVSAHITTPTKSVTFSFAELPNYRALVMPVRLGDLR